MKIKEITKRIMASILCLVLLASVLPGATAAAYEHPQGLWQHFDKWNTAVEDKDYATILELAPVIEALYAGEALNIDNSAMLSIVCENASRGLELRGDLDGALAWRKKQITYDTYINSTGKDYTDRLIMAEAMLRQLSIKPEIYATVSKPADVPYYGALGELRVGTLQGSVADGSQATDTASIQSGESAILIYVEFEPNSEHDMAYWVEYFTNCDKGIDALEGRAVIELAWNFPLEGSQLKAVADGKHDAYIKESVEYLNTLDTVVLLRVGAEMNVWTDKADPQQYIAAFRKIADITRKNSDNVALVFSPNDVSEWGKSYRDFYPGDNYVDWIGVSTYFLSSASGQTDYADAFYNTGAYSSNPLTRIRQLTETFTNKPIMISECGFAYSTPEKPDNTADAIDRMTKFYSYLTMQFPQVKAVLYFDALSPASNAPKYHFAGSSALKNAYLKLVGGETFLSDATGSAKGYTRLETVDEKLDSLKLSTYAVFPGESKTTCVYYLDGKQLATTDKVPYTAEIAISSLAYGTHTVKVEITSGNIKKTVERSFTVSYGNHVMGGTRAPVVKKAIPTPSKVYVNGKLTAFDAYNIDGSNYFKLRDLAFVLNDTVKRFSIDWDGAANAIIMKRGAAYKPNGGEMTAGGTAEKSAAATNSKLLLDGGEIALTAYNIDGSNYFKLRDIGEVFDFGVTWISESNAIEIDTSIGYTP